MYEFLELIKSDPIKAYEGYKDTYEKVKKSTAQYKGEPVPFLYHPMFFSKNDVKRFEQIGNILMNILDKVINRYINKPIFREKFAFDKLLEELILVEHGYKRNVPMGRFDIFDYGDDFKFCELNSDGSSGMNETNELDRIFLESPHVIELKKKYNIEYLELLETWVHESIEIYKEYSNNDDKPNVAIVDWQGMATSVEFEQFKKAYIKKGFNAVIVDPRDLKYVDGNLMYVNQKIDLVYRRLVTWELIDRHDEIKPFIQAIKDNAICVIGPIRSQIIHNKIIFKVLHDEDTIEYLTKDEIEFIKSHIPFTAVFDNSLWLNNAINDKDKYVLKPKDLYASKGVYVGRDYNVDEWLTLCKECFGNEYLVQEFCNPPEMLMTDFDNYQLKPKSFKSITGLYMYNGNFKGIYTRVSQNNVIASLHGCYNVANLVVD